MKSLLTDEHMMLGAQFAEDDEAPCVLSYAANSDEVSALRSGVGLVDLSGVASWLVSGTTAQGFVTTTFACEALPVGACTFGPALLGDGSVASVALVARTGDAEYVCWDLSDRADVLDGWMAFLAAVEQGGVRPFEGLEVEDVGESLVPLLLWGPEAPAVLADYLRSQPLPQPGSVASLKLDDIRCLVAAPVLGEQPAYLVLVPPNRARVLWRSFLSFPVVTPVGRNAFVHELRATLPWFEHVHGKAERVALSAQLLRTWGLLRDDATFVGARGLVEQ